MCINPKQIVILWCVTPYIPSKWGFRQFVVKWAYPMMLTSKNWSDDQKLSNAEVNSICQEAGMLAARDNRYEVWIIPFDKFDGRLIINRWLMNFRMWKKPTQIKSRIMTKCNSNIIIIEKKVLFCTFLKLSCTIRDWNWPCYT